MIKTIKYGLVLILIAGLIISCSESGDNSMNNDPSNLTLDVNINEDNSGNVEIEAAADNTIEFQFDLGDGSPVVSNASGSLSYQYETSGVYLLEVKAFGNSGRFTRKSIQLTIQVGDDVPGFNPDGYVTPLSYDGMSLIWQDEFTGNGLNQASWNFETGTGNGGWGNNELQYYRSENTTVADGYLVIEARKESFEGSAYTSSRLTTQSKFNFKHGRVDIRAILPEGQGIWPALWMLGKNITNVGWPACGEIDIMELVGHQPSVVHGTIHFGPPWPNNQYNGSSFSLSSGKFKDEFYVFSLIWSENKIEWYVNDELYITKTPADTNGFNYPFNEEFFFIFNIAVGGNWPGSPNGSTQFPQQMVVDYIRVFQET